MGALVNRRSTTVAAWPIAAVIVGLNVFLLARSSLVTPRGVERLERLGRLPAERPDERAVVGVVDLADAVVELELLQRGERAVARLHQVHQLLGPRPSSISSGSPCPEGTGARR